MIIKKTTRRYLRIPIDFISRCHHFTLVRLPVSQMLMKPLSCFEEVMQPSILYSEMWQGTQMRYTYSLRCLGWGVEVCWQHNKKRAKMHFKYSQFHWPALTRAHFVPVRCVEHRWDRETFAHLSPSKSQKVWVCGCTSKGGCSLHDSSANKIMWKKHKTEKVRNVSEFELEQVMVEIHKILFFLVWKINMIKKKPLQLKMTNEYSKLLKLNTKCFFVCMFYITY